MHLSRQIAAFLRAGLPILEAVHTIGAESENSSVRRMMNEIEDGLRAGERFSDCLDRYPKVFPPFYRGIVRSAELTGELDTVLARLSGYIERDLEARRKIKSAMIYPLDRRGDVRGHRAGPGRSTCCRSSRTSSPSLDAELPLPTRMLLGSPTSSGTGGGRSPPGIAALVVLLHRDHPDQPAGKYARDALLLKVPVLGETIQYALVERFCRVLGVDGERRRQPDRGARA